MRQSVPADRDSAGADTVASFPLVLACVLSLSSRSRITCLAMAGAYLAQEALNFLGIFLFLAFDAAADIDAPGLNLFKGLTDVLRRQTACQEDALPLCCLVGQ